MAKRKPSQAAPAAAAPAPDTPETAARRRELTLRLYALAGNVEAADEFERVRRELEGLGGVSAVS